MHSPLLSRSLGLLHPRDFRQTQSSERARALHAAPHIRFDGRARDGIATQSAKRGPEEVSPPAHATGANSISIDPFDGKYLLSGGADASISLWDLEGTASESPATAYQPLAMIPKSAKSHTFGVTALSFYPFDPYAFLSSSYDHTLRVWDTLSQRSAARFALPAPIYSHAISAASSHLLVAAATKHPHVRLLDLRSGASAHSLPGHEGAVLGVAWSPVREHALASAGADGCVRLWDIRRAGNILGTLDLEDSVGLGGHGVNVAAAMSRRRDAKAHVGPCNGVAFTDDGAYIVTCGHDERIRVWNADSGANTLVHFGPTVRNRVLATVRPLIVPSSVTGPRQRILLYPSGSEVMVLDLHEGTLLKRLRAVPGRAGHAKGEKGLQQRAADIAWREGHSEAYSAHTNGQIKAWIPKTKEDREVEKDLEKDEEESTGPKEQDTKEADRKRKRLELNEMFKSMTKQKITFT